jgi:hypothetical protein
VAAPCERNDTTVRSGNMNAAVYFKEMGKWENGKMGKCEVIEKVNSNELKWKQKDPNIKMP